MLPNKKNQYYLFVWVRLVTGYLLASRHIVSFYIINSKKIILEYFLFLPGITVVNLKKTLR